jgi:redox-sensitive bicupin YhaK (pirin superfamily)
MEIVTYVIDGSLSHRDTTGGSGVLARGDVQAMSAGSGIRHSEFNGSRDQKLRLLQIWLLPEDGVILPAYAQTQFSDAAKLDQLRLIASPTGEDGSLTIHQDAKVYASILEAGKSVGHDLAKGRGAWIQVAQGAIEVDGHALSEGDGAAIEDVGRIVITALSQAEFLLFDLA